ncbi:TPA: hypothetical protein ACVG9H_001247 [Enterobacter hormaechei]
MSNIDKRALREAAEKHGDDDILALLDELEAAKQDSAKWFKAFEKAVSVGARYEERIAEMQALARGVKQFSEFQICHYGATEDYAKGYIDCQNNYNKVLFAAADKGE